MKKVLIVTALSGFITAFLRNDINTLREMGYDVHCAANDEVVGTSMNREIEKELGITFHNITFNSKKPISKLNIKAARTLKKLIKSENFDIVHCHTPIAGLIARLICSKYRGGGTWNGCNLHFSWLFVL